MTESCETCRFWRATSKDGYDGTCRRHPPVVIYDHSTRDIVSNFPDVTAEDWCGEYAELKETP